jgi:hypothetical protein
MFLLCIIHLVPYKWYQSTFLYKNFGTIFFQVETCTVDVFKAQRSVVSVGKTVVGEDYMQEINMVSWVTRNHCFTLLETSVTPVGTPSSSTTLDNTCT